MHCPRCGHQQNSDEIRFCTKCGLEISDVKELLAPERRQKKANRKDEINRATRRFRHERLRYSEDRRAAKRHGRHDQITQGRAFGAIIICNAAAKS